VSKFSKEKKLPILVDVTPTGAWKDAETASISLMGIWKLREKVPIKHVSHTIYADIRWRQFKNGVVVLNNKLPKSFTDDSPIQLPWVIPDENEVKKYKIDKDGIWPTGVVVLFKPIRLKKDLEVDREKRSIEDLPMILTESSFETS
jgi:hypothetical protein